MGLRPKNGELRYGFLPTEVDLILQEFGDPLKTIFEWAKGVVDHPGSDALFGDYRGVQFYCDRHVDCQTCGKGSAGLWLTRGRYFRYVESYKCPGAGAVKEGSAMGFRVRRVSAPFRSSQTFHARVPFGRPPGQLGPVELHSCGTSGNSELRVLEDVPVLMRIGGAYERSRPGAPCISAVGLGEVRSDQFPSLLGALDVPGLQDQIEAIQNSVRRPCGQDRNEPVSGVVWDQLRVPGSAAA